MGEMTRSAEDMVPLSESDTATFAATRAIYVGTAGRLKFKTPGSGATWRDITNLSAGWHPIQMKALHTDSTVADIHGAY